MRPYEAIPMLSGAEPLWGHNRMFRVDRLGMARRVVESGQGLVRIQAPAARVVIVNDPELLHELLVEKAEVFEKGDMLRFALYPLAGEGLFTSRGELWRRQRKLMAPMFHQAQLRGYAEAMVASTERTMERWRDGAVVELARETTRIAMSVAGRTLFDADTFDETDALGEALTVALDYTSHIGGSAFSIAHILGRRSLELAAERVPPSLAGVLRAGATRLEGPLVLPGARGRRVREALGVLEKQVERMIAERRAAGLTRPDLLTRLLAAHDEGGAAMSDKQVRDEILTLFVAGHETTATGLAWSVHELCRSPSVYEALEREVDALDGRPSVDDLPRLPLALRVFKEALRLYPPVYFFGRTNAQASSLGPYEIPRFSNAIVLPLALHQRADLWPDPQRFDPDRFLPEAEARRHKLAWIPFSAGPRICIGNHFSMMEAQLVLATMLRRFRFELLAEERPEPSATLRPKGGMSVRLRAR